MVKKRINQADTAKLSYAQILVSGTIPKEETKVLTAIMGAETPLTRRQLNALTNIELSALCRVLYNLKKRATVKIIFKEPCPETGRKVEWYGLSLS